MKILIVCSETRNRISPFIIEQTNSLMDAGIIIEYFTLKQKGFLGYIMHYPHLIKKIKNFKPDIVHAHYGLSGMLAVLQQQTPVVITFHGSDVNSLKNRPISFVASKLSSHNIFVTLQLKNRLFCKSGSVIPCGVDRTVFNSVNKHEARKLMQLNANKKYILFSSSFDNSVKNFPLAKEALALLKQPVEIIELSGYTRIQVAMLMNAVDVCLMTSFSEGSPQFIKEAMACGCPIVTTNVGDVENIIDDTEGCYLCSYTPDDVAEKIKAAFAYGVKTRGLRVESIYNSDVVAERIVEVYNRILCNR